MPTGGGEEKVAEALDTALTGEIVDEESGAAKLGDFPEADCALSLSLTDVCFRKTPTAPPPPSGQPPPPPPPPPPSRDKGDALEGLSLSLPAGWGGGGGGG